MTHRGTLVRCEAQEAEEEAYSCTGRPVGSLEPQGRMFCLLPVLCLSSQALIYHLFRLVSPHGQLGSLDFPFGLSSSTYTFQNLQRTGDSSELAIGNVSSSNNNIKIDSCSSKSSFQTNSLDIIGSWWEMRGLGLIPGPLDQI